MSETCFLAQFSDRPCEGRLVRVHLIPQQLLKRELPRGVEWVDDEWRPVARAGRTKGAVYRSVRALCGDPRSFVPGCGGPMGDSGHHGHLDRARTLRIPRDALPPELEEFAAELRLEWWLEREYGAGPRPTDLTWAAPAVI